MRVGTRPGKGGYQNLVPDERLSFTKGEIEEGTTKNGLRGFSEEVLAVGKTAQKCAGICVKLWKGNGRIVGDISDSDVGKKVRLETFEGIKRNPLTQSSGKIHAKGGSVLFTNPKVLPIKRAWGCFGRNF